MSRDGWPARVLLAVLKIAVTFGALWLVFRNYDVARVRALLTQSDVGWLAIAGVVAIAHFAISVLRWQMVHRLLTGGAAPWNVLVGGLGRGLLLGQFLPAIIGTDAIRIAAVAPAAGVVDAARSVASDRILGTAALLGLELVTLPAIAVTVDDWRVTAVLAAISLAGIAVFALPLWLPAFPRFRFLQRLVTRIGTDLRLALGSALGIYAVALALLTHLMNVALFAALARGLGAPVSLGMSFVFLPSVMLISALPISLGGWGLREATVTLAFSSIGVDPTAAAVASILFGLTTPITGALGELAALMLHPAASGSQVQRRSSS